MKVGLHFFSNLSFLAFSPHTLKAVAALGSIPVSLEQKVSQLADVFSVSHHMAHPHLQGNAKKREVQLLC